jgi:predicted acyltransferase
MTGITIPFSMDNKVGKANGTVYLQLLRRFITLWLIGMVMQGDLMGLEWNKLKLYSNTLQAIATGYLCTAILYLNFRLRTLRWISLALLVVYAIPFLIDGDFSPQHNFAIKLDKAILGPFMDGTYRDTSGNWHFSKHYDYAWIWSSLTFTVTVMLGCFAGKMIKDNGSRNPHRVALNLFLIGIGCLAAGYVWAIYMPIIKRIWTSSMVLLSGGYCFLLLALFYYVIDVKQWGKPLRWLKVYGMNSIVAYFLGEHLNFRPIVHVFTYGLEYWLPVYNELILTFGNFLVIFLMLLFFYRNKIFVKI